MDPLLPPDPADPPPSRSAAAVRSEDHIVWSDPDDQLGHRIEPAFVGISWLLAMLASLAIAAVSALVVSAISDKPLTGGTDTELGVLTILAAMGTFLGFAIVMTIQLTHIQHNRLLNSLAVAALHLVIAGIAAAITLALGASPDVLIVFERTAAVTIVACGLAAGMVPAVGDRPVGTQTDATPTNRQL